MKKLKIIILIILIPMTLVAKSNKEFKGQEEVIQLELFLGEWYVIGVIPTIFEKNAVNGIETYSLNDDGTIKVKYEFYEGSPTGKKKTMYQKGWITNSPINSEWKVQPLFPFKLPYLILEVGTNYDYTVIGTNNFKYLWIMSRTPTIEDTLYSDIISRLELKGYDISKIQLVKQEW